MLLVVFKVPIFASGYLGGKKRIFEVIFTVKLFFFIKCPNWRAKSGVTPGRKVAYNLNLTLGAGEGNKRYPFI